MRVRKSPVDGDVLGTLSNGDALTLIGELNGWYKLSYKGHTGYVSGEYITLSDTLWCISFTVENIETKDAILSYLNSKGISPNVEKIGG